MYLMSACLCGVNCKYSGKNNLNKDCLRLFGKGEAILICPEQLGGLMTPRNPAEIQGKAKEIFNENKGKVVTNDGKDVTNNFIKGAEEVVKIGKMANVTAAILKEGSPSCGCNLIYDGTFSGKKIEGEGLTCHLLRKNGIGVISDEEYSRTIDNDNNLIYLSDYDYRRKGENESKSEESIVYTILNEDKEIIKNLPPNVEKQMKKLVISMAEEMFGMDSYEEISEATGFSIEDIKKILQKEKE